MDLYTRILDFLVRRVVAVAFLLGGAVIALTSVPYLMPGATVNFNGVPTNSIGLRALSVAFPLLVSLFGYLLFRAKPLRPWRGLH